MKTPSLQEIITSIQNHFINELNLRLLGRTFIFPFTVALAGIVKILYLFIASLMKNVAPDTADPESVGGNLERFGRLFLGRNPLPATQGSYRISVTGSTGTIPAGTTFKKVNADFVYQVDNATSVPGNVSIRSLDAGRNSILEVNDVVEITQPIVGINNTATVNLVMVEPTNGESTELYRSRVLEAVQREPSGASGADFRSWASDNPLVRSVYTFATNAALGEIDVFVEQVSEEDNPFVPVLPTTAVKESLFVQDPSTSERSGLLVFDPDTNKPLSERGRLSVGVGNVHIRDITLTNLTVRITDLTVDNALTDSVQELITDSILSYVYNIRPFVPGADDPNTRSDTLYSTKLSAEADRVLTDGQSIGNLELLNGSNIITEIDFTFGSVPNVTVTFVTS